MEDVLKLIETRINERVQEQLARFAQTVAIKYHIGLNDVLRCSPDMCQPIPQRPSGTVRCRGLCGRGKDRRQCTRNVKAPALYCGTHAQQGEDERLNRPSIINHGHTHPASVLYQEGCPKCNEVRRQKNISTVIDLGLLTK